MAESDLKEAVFLYNRSAGLVRGYRRRRLIVGRARQWGWRGEWVGLSRKRTADVVIERMVESGTRRAVVFCGGDGTIHSGLSAVLRHNLRFGIFPIGSGNILARNLGISTDIGKAVDDFFDGGERRVDVGVANGEPFLVSASMGVAADVMLMTKRKEKRLWGRWAYFLAAGRAVGAAARNYLAKVDGRVVFSGRAKGVWVVNVDNFGGVSVAGGGHIASGDLRLGVLITDGFWSWLELVFHVIRGKPYESRFYRVLPGKKISIEVVDGRVTYECDGTVRGKIGKLEIKVLREKARIIVPRSRLKRVIVFDFDGTLVDTFGGRARAGWGMPKLSEGKVEKLRNIGAGWLVKELRCLSFSLAQFTGRVRKEYAQEGADVRMFPGMAEMKKKLEGICELGIVTSGDADFVRRALSRNDWEGLAFVESDWRKSKVIERVIKDRNYDRQRVAYVGSEAGSIAAAKKAGVFSVGVAWGYDEVESLRKVGPDAMAADVGDLERILLKWADEGRETKAGSVCWEGDADE